MESSNSTKKSIANFNGFFSETLRNQREKNGKRTLCIFAFLNLSQHTIHHSLFTTPCPTRLKNFFFLTLLH